MNGGILIGRTALLVSSDEFNVFEAVKAAMENF